MLNCSGGWKLIVTDIGRGPLAVNRRPRYHTATHGSPRPRAPDLGGGSRPRPDEDGGDRARRRRRGARAPSTARDRRDHRRGDGPRGGGGGRPPPAPPPPPGVGRGTPSKPRTLLYPIPPFSFKKKNKRRH